MDEGLKIVNELWRLAQDKHDLEHHNAPLPGEVYIGLNLAVLLLSDPEHRSLWERMKDYAGD